MTTDINDSTRNEMANPSTRELIERALQSIKDRRTNTPGLGAIETYLKGALAEDWEKKYNDLGVKFDKELERWQERDEDELNKRKELEAVNIEQRRERKKLFDAYVRYNEAKLSKRDAVIAKAKEALTPILTWIAANDRNGECFNSYKEAKEVLAEIETLTKKEE